MEISNSSAALSNAQRLIQADQKLVGFVEHFDPFLVDWQYTLPSVIRDRIMMGTFMGGNGESQMTYIFKGSLGPQQGLSGWYDIAPSTRTPAPGVDAGSWVPKTYTWAFDSMTFAGLKTSWKSPNFSCYDWYTADKAREQLGMILTAGAESVSADKETFCRETYMKLAADNGKFVVMADGVGLDYLSNDGYKVTYNPRVLDSGTGATYIEFPVAVLPKISTLNWAAIDLLRQHYQVACPGAALKSESGLPVFAALTDINEFEAMVRNDPDLREDVRQWEPRRLIEGFDMGFKVFRGIAVSHDVSQARWRFNTISAAGVVRCTRVVPMMATKAGVAPGGGNIPEANPEYQVAEFGTFVIFLNDAFKLLVPDVLNNLAGMTFGPAPNYNGAWAWVNIPGPDNLLKETGFFFCRIQYYVKMLRYAQFAAIFLYRRSSMHTPKVTARIETSPLAEASAAVVSCDAVDTTLRTVTVTLNRRIAAGFGGAVTLVTTQGGLLLAAKVVKDATAPTYTLAWLSGADGAPTATSDVAVGAAVTVV